MISNIRNLWIGSLIIFMINGCAGLLNPETVHEEPREDVVLAMKIKSKLIEESTLSAAAIHVEADKGKVVLSGFVETDSQRQLAGSIAQQVPNVKQVDNKIEVK